jgi:hypothetical protein
MGLAGLFALSGGVALIEADAVMVAQCMISRPLLVGPLVGALCGDSRSGMILGALIEALSLERLPVGGIKSVNWTVAAACAVLLSAGPGRVPMPLSLPAGLCLGWGYVWIDGLELRRRGRLTESIERGLRAGRDIGWCGLFARSLGEHVCFTAFFVFGSMALFGPALSWGWAVGPTCFRAGMLRAFDAVLWIGLAALLGAFLRFRLLRWRRGYG